LACRLHSQCYRASLNNLGSSLSDANDRHLITRSRRQHLLVLSVTLPLFTKPDFSVRYSQKTSNRTFPKTDESDPRLRILLLNIHFNIILPSMPSPSEPSIPSSFSNRNPVCVLILHMHATHTIHHIFHTSSNNNWSVSQFAYTTHKPVLRHALISIFHYSQRSSFTHATG
jgi:hypothetical protein